MEDTKITISIKEYDELKNKIKALESEIASLDKAIDKKNDIITSYQDAIDFLENEVAVVDRVFYWKNVINDIKKDLNK